jgi:spermidine synthase
MGFSGLVAQLLLLRELLIVFSGNELSIGIILANWLILEAFGSFFLGKRAENTKHKIETFVIITVLFSLSLPVAVYFTRILKNILGVSIGQGLGLLPIVYSSFLILLPTSLSHGALFTFACKLHSLFSARDASSMGKVYVYETFGTLAGGVAVTYLLIPYLNAFHIAAGLAVLNFLVCALLFIPFWRTGKFQKLVTIISWLLSILGLSFIFFGGADKLHRRSIETQWKAQNVVHYQNSIYGNICVIENAGQYTFFSDGIPHIITPVPDIVFVEEFVHLPFLSHPRPKQVLILSGGAGGLINEVLKHPSVELVEYAELDPLVFQLLKKFPTPLTEDELNDSRVKVKYIDGRLLLKMTDKSYDVILIGLSEPSDLQTNRFFTKEFFSLAEKRLKETGILVIGLPGSLTYLNDELRDLNGSIFHTLKSVFPHLRVIPGEGTNIFLASNSKEISLLDKTRLIQRLSERALKVNLIVPRHIEYKLHPGWVDWFLRFIEARTQKLNYDFKPLGLFYSISHWNAIFTPYFGRLFRGLQNLNLQMFFVLFVIFIAFFFLIRTRNRRFFASGIPLCVGTTGFAGMMFDLILIFTFQAIYGYVFSWIGLLVSFFMAGAAIGAMKITSLLPQIKNDTKFFIRIDLAIICFSFILPFIFLILKPYLDTPGTFIFLRVLFLLLSFISGFLIGAQFPLANKIYFLKGRQDLSKTAGLIYSLDLLGGWFGGVVGGVLLLPILGLLGSCMVVVLLKLSSFLIITAQSRTTASIILMKQE